MFYVRTRFKPLEITFGSILEFTRLYLLVTAGVESYIYIRLTDLIRVEPLNNIDSNRTQVKSLPTLGRVSLLASLDGIAIYLYNAEFPRYSTQRPIAE